MRRKGLGEGYPCLPVGRDHPLVSVQGTLVTEQCKGSWSPSRPEFLNLVIIDILSQRILCCGRLSWHFRMFRRSLASTYWMPLAPKSNMKPVSLERSTNLFNMAPRPCAVWFPHPHPRPQQSSVEQLMPLTLAAGCAWPPVPSSHTCVCSSLCSPNTPVTSSTMKSNSGSLLYITLVPFGFSPLHRLEIGK